MLENSCGNGSFLVEIVKRYIEDCRLNGYSDDEIRIGLSRDICAYEIDPITYDECLTNLNRLTRQYSIDDVNWNIFNTDVLRTELPADFSLVIGNPPYITYSALAVDERDYIRKTFGVCTEGKPDYYYAFVESALNSLNAEGRMVYLLPSNFFKTRFGQKVRDFLLPTLTEVYDYSSHKVFGSALTASVVIVCDKTADTASVIYHDIVGKTDRVFNKSSLKERWLFNPLSTREHSSSIVRFGDCYPASCSIATLYNTAFVFRADAMESEQIETEVVRKAVSPKSESAKIDERIIFPYYFDEEGKLKRYSEEEFCHLFPMAAAYLKQYLEQLKARDSDKSAKWFEYGRSQAISHMNQEKLLVSTVITGAVKVSKLDKETIPYSGIYVVAKEGRDLSDAKRILESKAFYEYAKAVGIQANGTSIRIGLNDINNYMYAPS